jgi:ATP-binding cassette, subfamily B, bacterial MsbA
MRETQVLRAFVPLFRLYRWHVPVILLLGLLQSLTEGIGIGLFIPVFDLVVPLGRTSPRGRLLELMDGLFRGVAPERRLVVVLLCLFVAILTATVLAYSHGALFAWVDGRIGDHLRRRIFHQLLTVNFGFIERDRSGRLLHVLATDTWRTNDAFKMLVRVIVAGGTIAVYVTLLLLISWRLTMLVAGALLLISAAVRLITRSVRDYGDSATRLNAELGHLMLEGVDGMRVIRAFGRESYEQARFDRTSHEVSRAYLRMHLREEAVHPLHDLLAGALLLVILFVTARQGGDVSALLVFVFVLYRLQPRFKEFDASRVRLLALTPSVQQVQSLLDPSDKQYLTSGAVPHSSLESGIVFDSVTFQYDPADQPALSCASFTIPAGKTTAFVGLSGGGKSTVIKLILRFEDPTSGSILLDGRPLAEFEVDSWRRKLALVSQDVYLFNTTVRDNIAYGRLDATFDDIVDAARQADAHDFIMQLPSGYDTVLGPRGVRLSGGQQQRISLARAIIRNPSVLILDEATNALDSISEQLIQETLDKLREHRTVIMIAHRLSTIERADQIIVLDNGCVRERGTLRELIEARGLFAKMYRLQHRYSAINNA